MTLRSVPQKHVLKILKMEKIMMRSFTYSLLGYSFYVIIRQGDKPSSLIQEMSRKICTGNCINSLAPPVQSPLKSLIFQRKDSKSSFVYYYIIVYSPLYSDLDGLCK